MTHLFRDSTVGQLVNRLSKGRYLPYDDQRPGWTAPKHRNSSQSTLQEKVTEDSLSSHLVDWYDENDQDNPMYA
jgi:DHA1 family multidrug resistance protein-like MFS transporter